MAKTPHFNDRPDSDEALATMAQKGDTDAFSALTIRYMFAVKSRVAHYTDSGIEPDDLMQEGMIGLMNAVRGYKPDGGASFKTFAWLCIDRSVITAVKSTFRKKQVPASATVSIDDELPSADAAGNPETIVLAREDLKASMQKISERLTPFEKKVLNLYLSDCKYGSIAATLDCSVKSVDNALQRLRRKLR